MSDIVVFGTGQNAEVADFYFSCDSDYRVVALTIAGAHNRDERFLGRPVVPFESIVTVLSPTQVPGIQHAATQIVRH